MNTNIIQHICDYGCGQFAHYQMKNGKWCCKKSPGGCPAIIKKQIVSFKKSIENGSYIPSWTGKHHTDEQRKNLSEKMKIAHAEGRAHNIGESRWNNEPSYPEKWFMTVISNHFYDKNYTREYSFHRFSLDFAWVEKKKCIEIDGDQHIRFEENIERDKRKDEKLKEEGWEVLRLRWKDLKYNNTQNLIQKAVNFIGI